MSDRRYAKNSNKTLNKKLNNIRIKIDGDKRAEVLYLMSYI